MCRSHSSPRDWEPSVFHWTDLPALLLLQRPMQCMKCDERFYATRFAGLTFKIFSWTGLHVACAIVVLFLLGARKALLEFRDRGVELQSERIALPFSDRTVGSLESDVRNRATENSRQESPPLREAAAEPRRSVD